MRAVEDKIIVEQEIKDEVSDSGLITELGSSKNQNRGTVISRGPGAILPSGQRASMPCDEGDEVIFSGGTLIHVDGKEFIFLTTGNILARL